MADNETKRILTREVVMDIKADKEGIKRRITVVFDLTDLTEDQIADWATSANGIRVWYQNRERPKGDAHLVMLSKEKQTVKVPPTGTRMVSTPRMMTPEEMIAHFAKDPEAFQKYLEQLQAIKDGKGIEA